MADSTTTTTTAAPAAPATTTAAGGDSASLRAARTQLTQRTQELESLRGEIEQLRTRADTADTLASEVKRLKAEIGGLGEQHKTERALWAAGLTDPDEVELVKFAHQRIPEKDRPPLVDWLDQVKKDPSKAPKLISPIAERWKAPPAGKAPPATRAAPRVRPNKGTTPDDDTGSTTEPTADEWAEARRRALAGDRKLFDQLRERSSLPRRGKRR